MATIILTVKTWELRKNGEAPIVFTFTTSKGIFYDRTGKYILPKFFNRDSRHFVGRKYIGLDFELQGQLLKYNEAMELLAKRIDINELHPRDFRDRVVSLAQNEKHCAFVVERMEAFGELKTSPRTRDLYRQTVRRIKEFCPHWATLIFNDINKEWLRTFDAWLTRRGNRPNTRNIHFRNLRTIFNEAIDDDVTTHYPFRRFTLPKEQTQKRCLTLDELRILANQALEGRAAEARDIFMLTFFLIGINKADLYELESIDNGYITYRRNKTGRIISVKVEPEAAEIIERYRGGKKLLSTAERYGSAHGMALKINAELRALRPGLTLYWARHTWATLASEIDTPKETIAEALGHSVATVTDIYIKFNRRKIDEANRRVIDLLK